MRVVWMHTDEGSQTAILGDPGRKWTPFVMIEFPVRLRRIKNADVGRYTKELEYPLKKACRAYLKIGRKHGITKGAKTLIRKAQAV